MLELWNGSEFWRILINILGVVSIIVALLLLYISFKIILKYYGGKKIKESKKKYAKLYELPGIVLKDDVQLGFDLPELLNVKLSISDLNDKELKIIFQGEKDAGEHVFIFNSRTIENGEYFLNFKSKNQIINKKMIIQN